MGVDGVDGVGGQENLCFCLFVCVLVVCCLLRFVFCVWFELSCILLCLLLCLFVACVCIFVCVFPGWA